MTVAATAWAGADTAMSSIQVNVVRPPVAITEPVRECSWTGTADLTISGVTFADLFALPVESVVVDIVSNAGCGTTLTATGTDSWSVVWHTTDVAAITSGANHRHGHGRRRNHADTIIRDGEALIGTT